LIVGETFRLNRVNPEAERDQDEDTGPEEEAALPFQARLAQQSLERTIGHVKVSGIVGKNALTVRPSRRATPASRNERKALRSGRTRGIRSESCPSLRCRRRNRGCWNHVCRLPAAEPCEPLGAGVATLRSSTCDQAEQGSSVPRRGLRPHRYCRRRRRRADRAGSL